MARFALNGSGAPHARPGAGRPPSLARVHRCRTLTADELELPPGEPRRFRRAHRRADRGAALELTVAEEHAELVDTGPSARGPPPGGRAGLVGRTRAGLLGRTGAGLGSRRAGAGRI